MSEDWDAVAAEVADAIASIGDVSQPEGFPAALRRIAKLPGANPWDPEVETDTYLTIRIVDDNRQLRDINGTMIRQTVRTLTLGVSVPPLKTDMVAIGITGTEAETAAGVDPDTTLYHAIKEVRPLAPAGVVVLYEIELVA